jgi:hypothetical protein
MIKSWLQFIKESNNYWLETSDVEEAFISLKDEGYGIVVKKAVFMEQDSKIIWMNPENDIISLIPEYYFGFQILIKKSPEKCGDITMDFKSSINYLRNEGYEIQKVWDEEDPTSVDNLHFIKGSIITWIPEKSGKPLTFNQDDFEDGDIYVSSASVGIYIYQPEKVDIVAKDLAEIYNWSGYTTDSSGNIYCELDIEDMADNLLSRRSSYKDTLVNGTDYDNYESHYYQPDIDSLFSYDLKKENEILAVKALIEELGGLDEFIKECDNENLEGKSEDEIINFLLKERFYSTLEPLCKESEIIGDIRQTIADWKSQAHCDRNQEELEEEFDRIIGREEIEFTKSRKEGQRYYYRRIPNTDRKEKVYYDEIVWFYQVKFDEKWITDYGKALPNYSLKSVFGEWCSDCYFENELKPHFSDWGDVDSEALNKEIGAILKNYLKE